MTALNADRTTRNTSPFLQTYPVKGSTHIYKGAMVCLSSGGFLIPAADAASISPVIGVAAQGVNNVGGDGAVSCAVRQGYDFLLVASSITQAMVGTVMHVVDDQTFDDGAGSHSVVAGVLAKYVGATSGWIRIDAAANEAFVAALAAALAAD